MDQSLRSYPGAQAAAAYRYGDTLPASSRMLEDLLKSSEIAQLFEAYYTLLQIPTAIVDLEGNILFSSRWQRVCTQFHRAHPDSCARCIESDTRLALQLKDGRDHSIYRCLNGLIDCASPIVIEGAHIANLFIGQFLTEPPDEGRFRRQADEFGFDRTDYLRAVGEVPIVDEARIPVVLDLLTRMTRVITNMGVERKRAVEAQVKQSLILAAEQAARDALTASELKYRALFEAADDAILLFAGDRCIDCNGAALKTFGCSPDTILGAHPRELSPPTQPDGSDSTTEAIRRIELVYTLGPQEFEWMHCRADGTPFLAEVRLNRLDLGGHPHIQAIVRDITELRRAEVEREQLQAQLIQAQKMESVGRLAGGVAHDFNNLLTVISGFAEFVLSGLPEGDPKRHDVHEIITASSRAAGLTRQLLAFSRRQILNPQLVDINDAVGGTVKMLTA